MKNGKKYGEAVMNLIDSIFWLTHASDANSGLSICKNEDFETGIVNQTSLVCLRRCVRPLDWQPERLDDATPALY